MVSCVTSLGLEVVFFFSRDQSVARSAVRVVGKFCASMPFVVICEGLLDPWCDAADAVCSG